MTGIASPAPRLKAMGRPKALGNRRSGRAGEPAVGESVGASESLDDAPQDPRLPSYPPDGPTHRLPDLYGSLSRTFGISWAMSAFLPLYQNSPNGENPSSSHRAYLAPVAGSKPSRKTRGGTNHSEILLDLYQVSPCSRQCQMESRAWARHPVAMPACTKS